MKAEEARGDRRTKRGGRSNFARFATPEGRARWLLSLVPGPPIQFRPDPVRRRLEQEARDFADPGEFAGLASDTKQAKMETELEGVRSLFRALGLGEPEVLEVERWSAELHLQHGRLVAAVLFETPWPEAFRWKVYETLMAVKDRLRFCRRPDCRRPFLARKKQLYCRESHARSATERNRSYYDKNKKGMNEKRRAAYRARLRAQHGRPIRIQGEVKPSSGRQHS